ncbi:hypothetical protein J0J37_22575, partial [Vibrio vulnificus]|uniref:hypothetical protein n=1 Tax=Vibrio vulnificus TaxID=672 RepID=UPI0019D4371D
MYKKNDGHYTIISLVRQKTIEIDKMKQYSRIQTSNEGERIVYAEYITDDEENFSYKAGLKK